MEPVPGPTRSPDPRWLAVAGLALAGAIAGLGHHPGLGVLAWLGLAGLAFGLRAPLPPAALAAGLVAFALARVFAGHPWHLAFTAVYLPGGATAAWLAIGPIAALWIAPTVAVLGVGALAARRAGLPTWAWLPPAWWLAEALHDAFSGLSHDAWLYSQWQAEPVLRAVGHLGWTPALLLCLALAAAAAEAVAARGRAPAAAAVAGGALIVLLVLPPLPAAGPAAFAGVGAVHEAGAVAPLREAPAGLTLLVWPEVADRQQPRLAEGKPRGAFVEPPAAAPGLHHLLGLRTRVGRGLQNAVVALDPGGAVLGVRAKSRLFPLTEGAFLGLRLPTATRLSPGAAPPVLEVAGRRAGVLLCGEAADRGLAAGARRAGATILAIGAIDDGVAGTPLGQAQLLAVAVLRAVETGLPVVRASRAGVAALIDRDGRVVARSAAGTEGVLTAAGDAPAAAPRDGAPPGGLAVLYSARTPRMLPRLPAAAGGRYAIEGFAAPGVRAATVILSGDSMPPRYLGRPAAEVARAIAAFRPELVVLDTCFGASTPLLEALAAAGVRATVVGPAFRIPAEGLVYEPGFLGASDAGRRAARVRTDPPFPLLRWRLEPGALAALEAELAAQPAAALRKRLKRARPPLVQAELPGTTGPTGRVLALVPPERFKKRD